MQKSSVQKLSVLGLIILLASVTASAILNNKNVKVFNGRMAPSTGGDGDQITCVNIAGVKDCTFTSPSSSTGYIFFTDGSSVADNGSSATPDSLNSSRSPS